MIIQGADFDHRIQPETESVIKMIMDTPFVVMIFSPFAPPISFTLFVL